MDRINTENITTILAKTILSKFEDLVESYTIGASPEYFSVNIDRKDMDIPIQFNINTKQIYQSVKSKGLEEGVRYELLKSLNLWAYQKSKEGIKLDRN